MDNKPFIHPLSDCQSPHIGGGTRVWQFCVILPEARIGRHCNICASVLIENKVVVGDHTTIKSGVQLWDGITLGHHVLVGPNVTFTNDRIPRSQNPDFVPVPTVVDDGASIGAGSTIVAGIHIGQYALIGAGSVVTKDVPPFTVWYGNPARQQGYITREGVVLNMERKDKNGVVHEL